MDQIGLIGRLFGTPKRRIGAEEFGRILAEFAQDAETGMASNFAQILDELKPNPLGITLVSASAVVWSAAHHGFVGRLPGDRFSAFADTYYADVWERIKSRFGADRTLYDEFVRRLGGLIMPDSIKTEWALRSGVHDILHVAVTQIGQAADEFIQATTSDERSAKGIALGDAIGRVVLGGTNQVSAKVSLLAYGLFMDFFGGIAGYFQDLEKKGVQVV